MKLYCLAAAAALTVAACAGPAAGPNAQPLGANAALPVAVVSDAARTARRLLPVHFRIRVPKVRRHHRGRRAAYVPAHAASIAITLKTVNGAPPPAGLVKTAVTNLTHCANGCSVGGPSSPPGSDAFTLTLYDAVAGGGNAVAMGSVTISVHVGLDNQANVTMNGVPKTFALVGTMPAGTGGTAFASAASLAIDVEDADGDVIVGTYAQSVTVTDTDAASLTLASGLTLTGAGGSCAAPATAVVLTSSTDSGNAALCYGGLDIVPAAIQSTTSLMTTPATIGSFAPVVQNVAYTGTLNSSNAPEVDLWVPSGPSGGIGSFSSWTDSQLGWTNAPYDKALSEQDNCNGGGTAVATFQGSGAPAGTAWQSNAVASPSPGTCTFTLTGGGGAQLKVTTTYTTTSYGVN